MMTSCSQCGHEQVLGKFCGQCGQLLSKKLPTDNNSETTDYEGQLKKTTTNNHVVSGISKSPSSTTDIDKLIEWARQDVNNPLPHIEIGQQYLDQNQLEKAKKEFQVARALNPDYIESYYFLGKTYYLKNEIQEGIRELQKMEELAPADPSLSDCKTLLIFADGLQLLGICFSKVAACDNAINKLLASLDYYARFLEENTIVSGIYYQEEIVLATLIELYIEKENLENAGHQLQVFEKKFGSNAKSIALKARIFQKKEFWDGALAEYQKLLQLVDDPIKVRLDMAQLFVNSSSFDRAILEYQNILKELPDNMEAHLKLGRIFKELKMFDKADECFARLKTLAPENIDLRLEFAREATKAGHYRIAIKELKTVLQIDAYNQRAHLDLIHIFNTQNNEKEAEEYLKNLLQRYPDNIEALKMRGSSHVRKREYQQARKIYQKIHYLDNSDRDALYHMGFCLIKLGRDEDSRLCFDKIKALEPEDNRAYIFAELIQEEKYYRQGEKMIEQAESSLKRGNLMSAISKIEKALSLLPSEAGWRRFLSDLYFRVGNFAKSKATLEGLAEKDREECHSLARLGLLNYIEENIKESLDIFSKLVTLEPDNFNHFLEYLWLHYEFYSGTDFLQEAYHRRLKDLEEEESLPEPINYCRRGFLHLVIGPTLSQSTEDTIDQAEDFFLQALDKSPDLNAALYGLMKVGCFTNDFPKVYSYYQQMEKIAISERIHLEFLYYCRENGHYKEGFRTLDFLILNYPENHYYRALKIQLKSMKFSEYDHSSKRANLLQDYQQALGEDSKNARLCFEYGLALLFLSGTNEPNETRKKVNLHFNRALKLNPEFYWAHWGNLLAYLKYSHSSAFKVNFPAQLALCEKLCKQKPEDIYARFYLGYLLTRHPEEKYLKKAQAELVKVLANRKFFLPAYESLIEVAKKRGLKSKQRYLGFRYQFLMGNLYMSSN